MRRLVALDIEGGPAFVDALERIWGDGDVVCPLDTRLAAEARADAAAAMGASLIVTPDGTVPLDRGAQSESPVEMAEGDALVMSTSGTTGAARGVVLTHDALSHNATTTSLSLGSSPDSWWLACLPLGHIGGFSVVSRALLSGARLTVFPRFDAGATNRSARDGCTHVSLVPTALARIDPALFERILVGGGPATHSLPPNCVTSYGMTETCGGLVHDGTPLGGAGFRIERTGADTEGGHEAAPPGESGRVAVSTPSLLRCYLDGADPTTTGRDGRRWFATGDVGIADEDGRLTILGRADDMIITGGENVWPEPVEAALRSLPGVDDAAVIGRLDREWGQRVTAVVVPAAGSEPALQDCVEAVRHSLPPYAAPKELVLVRSLPRTALGKLQRGLIRHMLDDPPPAPR